MHTLDVIMETLKQELKQLIIDECDKDFAADDIGNAEPLLDGKLDLDSLDVLQACMAIKTRYGVRIEGSNASRKLFKTIDTLAEHISKHRSA